MPPNIKANKKMPSTHILYTRMDIFKTKTLFLTQKTVLAASEELE